jgi:2-iminobutanoate/2-iminopropanoate deaminase
VSTTHCPRAITAPGAPAPVGPYSHAVAAGDLVFLSGQIPLDPSTNAITGTTASQQATQCLRNVAAVLESQGLGMQSIVKVTIFLTDMTQFAAVNQVYEAALGGWKPARSVVEVRALPKGALVEIEAVACR